MTLVKVGCVTNHKSIFKLCKTGVNPQRKEESKLDLILCICPSLYSNNRNHREYKFIKSLCNSLQPVVSLTCTYEMRKIC